MMELLEQIEIDADIIRDLTCEIRISEEDSAEEGQAFTALVSVVQLHFLALDPVLQSLMNDGYLKDQSANRLRERIQSARELERIIECCVHRSTWRASINVYCELLDNLIADETRGLVSCVHDKVPRKERVRLGQVYRRTRNIGLGPKRTSQALNWQEKWDRVLGHSA